MEYWPVFICLDLSEQTEEISLGEELPIGINQGGILKNMNTKCVKLVDPGKKAFAK